MIRGGAPSNDSCVERVSHQSGQSIISAGILISYLFPRVSAMHLLSKPVLRAIKNEA
jgi:hypothetical protein